MARPSSRAVSSPLLDDELCVRDGFLAGRAVGHAAGQFGDFDDETLVGAAPVDDEFIANRASRLRAAA